MPAHLIKVMDKDIFLYSESEISKKPRISSPTDASTVILSPSRDADFNLEISSGVGNGAVSEYEAAAAGASFLISKRGLPLDEIRFNVGERDITVFYTGWERYSIILPKCEVCFTNDVEISGCPSQICDVRLDEGIYRIVVTESLLNFDVSVLPCLLTKIPAHNAKTAIALALSERSAVAKSYTAFESTESSMLTSMAVCCSALALGRRSVGVLLNDDIRSYLDFALGEARFSFFANCR